MAETVRSSNCRILPLSAYMHICVHMHACKSLEPVLLPWIYSKAHENAKIVAFTVGPLGRLRWCYYHGQPCRHFLRPIAYTVAWLYSSWLFELKKEGFHCELISTFSSSYLPLSTVLHCITGEQLKICRTFHKVTTFWQCRYSIHLNFISSSWWLKLTLKRSAHLLWHIACPYWRCHYYAWFNLSFD